MKIFLVLWILTLTTFIFTSSYAQPHPTSCPLTETESASWLNCDGKQAKVSGTQPSPLEIMQHPMMNGPRFSTDAAGNPIFTRTEQSYLNVGKRQIILVSDTVIECQNEIEVTGILERISLGGSLGTKESYKGWFIRVSKYECF